MASTNSHSNAAHATSWIRFENNKPVLAALRNQPFYSIGNIKAEYKNIISSDVTMVAASLNNESLTETNKLGIVPFGDGKVAIRNSNSTSKASIKTHYLDGTKSNVMPLKFQGEWLQIPVSEKEQGKWIEWYEITISK